MPVVSVVMAVRDGETYLREAVDSILRQTLEDFEFIIVDDGSTDRTSEILASFDDPRMRLITQTGRGIAPSLNAGIRQARAPLIARMDADDISEHSRLQRQVEFLSLHRDHVLVGSDVLLVSERGEALYRAELVTENTDIQRCLVALTTPFYHGAVMFRRDAAVDCGLYDERVPNLIEDMLLWLRLRHVGAMASLPEPLYRYRFRPGSVSRLSRSASKRKATVLRRYAETLNITGGDMAELRALATTSSQRERRASYELDLGKIYLDEIGDRRLARGHFFRAAVLAPSSLRSWFNLGLSLAPVLLSRRRIARRNRRIQIRAETHS